MSTAPSSTTSPSDTVLAILRSARKLLSKNGNWTKGNLARDSDGIVVDVTDPSACKFCLMGAIYVAAHRQGIVQPTESNAEFYGEFDVGGLLFGVTTALRPFVPEYFGSTTSIPFRFLWRFNDHEDTTQLDVIAALDDAIASLSDTTHAQAT